MGILDRFVNAMRGGAETAGEKVMENSTVADYELKGSISKLESALAEAKTNHGDLAGNVNTATRQVRELEEVYNTAVNAARKAMGNGDQERAAEFAGQADGHKAELDAKKAELAEYKKGVEQQKASIRSIKSKIDKVKRGAKMLQAEKSVVKARQVASHVVGVDGDETDNALAVLERQRKKVQEQKDRLDAVEDIYEESQSQSAEDYLKESGEGSDTLAMLMAESDKDAK